MRCIAVYSKGFICSGGNGTVCLFEKTDNKNVFKKAQTVGIWVDAATQPPQLAGSEAPPPTSNEIRSLSLSPSEESVICTTTTQQIYSLSLSNSGIGKVYFATAPGFMCATFCGFIVTSFFFVGWLQCQF